MAVSYDRLWKLLIDMKKSKADLRCEANLAPNTLTRLRRGEPVTLPVLDKICEALDCDYGDIISYVPDTDDFICPACGGKLDLMRIEQRPGIIAGRDILASCRLCDLDWMWHQDHDGTAHEKKRFFHG